jgi:spoIIIJ-associated protein
VIGATTTDEGAVSVSGDETTAPAMTDVAGPGRGRTVRDDAGTGDERLDELEAEGDAAADYLEELMDIVDLDGDIDIFVENDRPSVAIVGEGPERSRLQVLVGRDGRVLDALQELARLAVQASTGRRSRLILDVGGWREARRREAAAVAERVIEEVRNGGAVDTGVELAPMPAYQRKVVHDLVAEAGLRSESAGVEPERRVVVFAG